MVVEVTGITTGPVAPLFAANAGRFPGNKARSPGW